MTHYSFRRAGREDLPRLNRWLREPHVARWWDDEVFDEEYLADPQSRVWIVALDGTPFAFAQDYAVHGFGPHHFDYLPPGARGIDQFIGDAALCDRGHGSAFVAAQIARLFAEGVPTVGTDPHPDNARAIRAYEKAGFARVGPPQDTAWGRCQRMEAWRPHAPR